MASESDERRGAAFSSIFRELAQTPAQSWQELKAKISEQGAPGALLRIDVLRHGETTANAAGLVTGSQDVALTSKGRDEASRVSSRIVDNYDLAVASGLRRSHETLELLYHSNSHVIKPPIAIDKRLAERSLGVSELTPRGHVPEFAAGNLRYAPDEGESYASLALRVIDLIADLFRAASRLDSHTASVLLSGHMGPMRLLAGVYYQDESSSAVLRRQFANTELLRLSFARVILPAYLSHASD